MSYGEETCKETLHLPKLFDTKMNFSEGEGNAYDSKVMPMTLKDSLVFGRIHLGPVYLHYYFPNFLEIFLKGLFKKFKLSFHYFYLSV